MSDQDSVRLLAVEGCAALGKLLEPQDCVAHILPVIVNFSQVYMLCFRIICFFFLVALCSLETVLLIVLQICLL